MQTQVVVKEQVDKYKCPYCGASAIQFIEKHPVCADCGLVIDQAGQVENDQPRRGRMRKRGEQHILPDCMDIKAFIDFLGFSDSVEENMARTIASIINVAGKLDLGDDVVETAIDIYEDVAKKCTFKGKNIKVLSAAIVYAASKRTGKACGLREIARTTRIKSNRIFKCYRFILDKLGYNAKYPSIEGYVARICDRLALNASVTDIAKKIAVTAKDCVQVKAAPSSLAAASIYISSTIIGNRITQREIANVAGITDATVRSTYKDIIKKLQVVLMI
ncbi:transcription initiation factor IIB family protein [Candidatus Bathyarchaeota archaeon]|nr:transcription initiation factor IIB family protein [Candidatus Bathyarchaeota archaeon]